MARGTTSLPAWVPVVIGLLTVAAVAGPPVIRRLADSRERRPGHGTAGPGERETVSATRREAASLRLVSLPAIRITGERLGAPQVSRFAFDPSVPGRVVACGRESRDGGRTWTRSDFDASEWAMLLGARKGAPAVAGSGGRILCGDVILPGEARPAGVTPLRIAAEWTPGGWRDAGLPIADPDPRSAGQQPFDVAVGYADDGRPFAVRGDHVVGATRTLQLPGSADAWATDAAGGAYAAVRRPGRRPQLVWAPTIRGPWHAVATPGDVRALTTDGERAYAVAGMLGRGSREGWDWTRWPSNVAIAGVTARGTTVVAWGEMVGDRRGGYVVSRDGGATLRLGVHGSRPAWAALDPFAPSELLVLAEDGQLTRLRIE